MVSRQMAARAQAERRAQLDTLRLARPLSPQEQDEADNLAQRLYMREWRATFGRQCIRSSATRQSDHAA